MFSKFHFLDVLEKFLPIIFANSFLIFFFFSFFFPLVIEKIYLKKNKGIKAYKEDLTLKEGKLSYFKKLCNCEPSKPTSELHIPVIANLY